MKFSKHILFLFAFVSIHGMVAQPYVEISSFNFQTFSAPYQNNASIDNTTNIYTLNLFLPMKLKNGHAVLFRLNGESIHSQADSNQYHASTVSSVSAAFGFQWVSKTQQYKTTFFTIQKLASDFASPLRNKDWQYGALLLESYKCNDKMQVKAGIYYNREAFGDFFVPLLGLDWKASDKIYFYGMLPTNYKIEYAISSKVAMGVNFKAMTRSFQLASAKNDDYIRFDEVVLKYYAEYYCNKNWVLSADIGYSLGENPLQYHAGTKQRSESDPIYTPTKKYPVAAIGFAYRIPNRL